MFLPLTLIVCAAQPLGLSEARTLALRGRAEIAQAQLAVSRAEAGVDAAGALPNPNLIASVGPDEPTVSGGFEQRLPIFGQRGSAIDAAGAEIPIAKARLAAARLSVEADVERAYFALAAAQEQRAIAEDEAKLTAELARVAKEKYRAGSAAEVEAEQAALEQARAEAELATRSAELTEARLALAQAIGSEDDYEAKDPLFALPAPPPLTTLVAHEASHPSLAEAQGEQRAALLRADKERADVRPVPTVSVEVEKLSGSPSVGVRGGLSIEAPIFSQNQGAIRDETLQAEQARVEAAARARVLEQKLRAAYLRFSAAVAKVRLYQEKLVPQAQKVASLAELAYSVGRGPLDTVLHARADAAAIRSEAVNAAKDAWSAHADLEEASGVAP